MTLFSLIKKPSVLLSPEVLLEALLRASYTTQKETLMQTELAFCFWITTTIAPIIRGFFTVILMTYFLFDSA